MRKKVCKENNGERMGQSNMNSTITFNPAVSDGGVQFVSVYLDKLIGAVKKLCKKKG